MLTRGVVAFSRIFTSELNDEDLFHLAECQIVVYHRAHLTESEVVASEAHTASTARKSQWVLANFGGAMDNIMASILFYAMIFPVPDTHASAMGQCVRVAVCDLYPTAPVDSCWGSSFTVRNSSAPSKMAVPLNLDSGGRENSLLQSKQVLRQGSQAKVFLKYHHTFSCVDPSADAAYADMDHED